MSEDFIVVDMPETDDSQIILGMPILVTASCHINVREGHISFEVEGRSAVFSPWKEDAVSPQYSILDTLPLSLEYDMEDVLYDEDLPDFKWISYENPNQGSIRV